MALASAMGRQQGARVTLAWSSQSSACWLPSRDSSHPPTPTYCLLARPTCRLPEHTTTQWHRPRLPPPKSTTARMACHCTTLRTAATTAHPLPLLLPATRLRQRPSAATGVMSVSVSLCARMPLCASLKPSCTDAPSFRSHKASTRLTTATFSTPTGSRSSPCSRPRTTTTRSTNSRSLASRRS